MRITLGFAVAALAAGFPSAAGAEELAPPLFSFSGYGTLGVVHSSDDKSDYLVDAFKPTGPGFTRSWSPDVDSRIGAQVTANFTPRLSAVVQVISQQRSDNSYAPSVEWANVKYEVTPDLSVRAGRVVLPVFMVTDSRKIGYANPWVRPPVEVYGLVPVTNSDGVDASYRVSVGESIQTIQLTMGRSDPRFARAPGGGAGKARVRDIFAFADTFEYGYATARVSFGRGKLTIPEFTPLFDAFRQFGPPGIAIADQYAPERSLTTFIGLGASYDPGRWFVTGEWAKVDTRSVVGASHAWYVSGGYRIGKFTPYATYARVSADGNASDPGLPVASLPPQVAETAAILNATLNSLLGGVAVQKTASVGVRWDFMKNAALNLQFDHVSRGAGSAGTFGNLQPGFQFGGKARIFSAAVDFVF